MSNIVHFPSAAIPNFRIPLLLLFVPFAICQQQPLFPITNGGFLPVDQSANLWPYTQQQRQGGFFLAPYTRSRIPSVPNGAYSTYLYGYPPSFPPSNDQGRSAFAQGIESGFGQLFPPRYTGQFSQQSSIIGSPGFQPSPRRFQGPNYYNGYGTNSGLWPGFSGGLGTVDSSGPFGSQFLNGQFLAESLFDRENFQSRGCGWEQARGVCSDLLGICKGGCHDFSYNRDSLLHDCRCVPVGYSALLMGGGTSGGKRKKR